MNCSTAWVLKKPTPIILCGLLVACSQNPAAIKSSTTALAVDPAQQTLSIPEQGLTAGQYAGILLHVDRKSRELTLKLKDDVRVRLKATERAGDLTHLKTGDLLLVMIAGTAEIHADFDVHPETGNTMDRPAPGSPQERENYNPFFHQKPTRHHASSATADYLELAGKITALDEVTGRVHIKLLDQGDLVIKPSAGSDGMDDFSIGDQVVIHCSEIDSIMVQAKPLQQHSDKQGSHESMDK